ncbi:uncharacterized protein [Elaeis guineensis]|uniref:Uncharacterized protein LOC105034791 n=1 Tax=Elaeis guineensis var. tenera TaxID=51953 RepID=A0A6I9QF38_ELAGV|nr:uncharacterized protein LOC105034791 [Elaeis guineensis]
MSSLSPPFRCPSPITRPASTGTPSPRPYPVLFLQRSTVPWPMPFQSPRTTPNWFSKSSSSRVLVPLALSSTSGNSDGYRKLYMDAVIVARKLFDAFPQPVKSFPWSRALVIFQNLIFELARAVAKYLCIPLLAVTSLSEMSYCAHERKMGLIPIPFLVGLILAGVLKDAAIELSSDLKKGGFPWHLLLIAIFFTLLKLPGPYYPYWGRLLIPHFANGGLWRTVWLALMWYRRPHVEPEGATRNQ